MKKAYFELQNHVCMINNLVRKRVYYHIIVLILYITTFKYLLIASHQYRLVGGQGSCLLHHPVLVNVGRKLRSVVILILNSYSQRYPRLAPRPVIIYQTRDSKRISSILSRKVF